MTRRRWGSSAAAGLDVDDILYADGKFLRDRWASLYGKQHTPLFAHALSVQNATETGVRSETEAAVHWQLMLYSLALFLISGAQFALLRMRHRMSALAAAALEVCAWSSLWFAFSVSLVVYNKWLLHYWRGTGFAFPITMSAFHMTLKLCLSWLYFRCKSRATVPSINWRNYLLYAVPVGAFTGFDVGASNAAFMFVTVSFYTTVKSSSLVFTLLFSVIYGIEPCRWSLWFVTILISGGLVMVSFGEPEFDAEGLALVLVASAMGGLRWAQTQLLMRGSDREFGTLETIYLISPASALSLVPLALWFEGSALLVTPFLRDANLAALVLVNMLGSGLFAFSMIYVELALLARTSPLSLSIIGYVKTILQIVLSIAIFGDTVTVLNALGMVLTIGGMVAFTLTKNPELLSAARKTLAWLRGESAASVQALRDVNGSSSHRGSRRGYVHLNLREEDEGSLSDGLVVGDDEDEIPIRGGGGGGGGSSSGELGMVGLRKSSGFDEESVSLAKA